MCPQPLSPDPPEYFVPKDHALENYRDVGYFRRGGFRQRWGRLVWALAAVGVSLAAVGLTRFGARERRVFQSRRLSVAHGSFNHECAKCHATGFATAERLWQGDDSIRAVTNDACAHCHSATPHHFHVAETTACASCHREHQGDAPLAAVGSGHCTACHAHHDPGPAAKEKPLVRNVTAFQPADNPQRPTRGHPEFALWGRPEPRDPGTLKFNHHTHLNPKGPIMKDGPRVTLDCNRCHVPDDAGRFMRPIRYDTHCAECHPMLVAIDKPGDDPAVKEAAAHFARTPAPHPQHGEGPDTVLALLRQRYVTFVQEQGAVVQPGDREPPPRPVPGRAARLQPLSETEWDWVNSQLAKARKLVFHDAQGCRYCHPEVGHVSSGLPRYAPPAINDHWLTHAAFSHGSHRAQTCETCHSGVPESEKTEQVLLPHIAKCMTCHKPGNNAARADCYECHRYHDRTPQLRPAIAFPAPEALKGATHGDRR